MEEAGPQREEIPKFEDLSKECRSVLSTMEMFDGFRFEINKTITERPPFAVVQSFGLGSATEEPNYNFAANLFDGQFMYSGRVDTTGSMMGRLQTMLSPTTLLRFSGQASPEPHNSGVHVELDFGEGNTQWTMKWGNPGFYSLSYVQRFTKSWFAGMETVYMHKQGIAIMSCGGRYDDGEHIVTGILNPGHIALSYTRRLRSVHNSTCHLSTELVMGLTGAGPESSVQCGVEYVLQQGRVKSYYDLTNWKVGALVEESMGGNVKFALSGELDHFKKTYRFGIGLTATY